MYYNQYAYQQPITAYPTYQSFQTVGNSYASYNQPANFYFDYNQQYGQQTNYQNSYYKPNYPPAPQYVYTTGRMNYLKPQETTTRNMSYENEYLISNR